ncbi:MAG: arginine decarboxylase, partial [Deltaproteobacteria bacterium]|nr:arginine decarboxylase [Deltaproteobacteria bacterium]
VRLGDDGDYEVEHLVDGDNVNEVLSYVQYDLRSLSERVRKMIEASLHEGRISLQESALLRRRFDQGLADYTYLVNET